MEPGEPSAGASITVLLRAAGRGDAEAARTLLPRVYDELRQLARASLRKQPHRPTIQATELVHEAWIRLSATEDPGWESRAHFFGAAANAMRNILVDAARRKATLKRGAKRTGEMGEIDEEVPEILPALPIEDVLSLDDALTRFEHDHERQARVVSLRFFTGLSMEEVAELLGLSLATAERDWRFARAWLLRDMGAGKH
jgi:RNA polymerase sigma factor (TIGR02999 family)